MADQKRLEIPAELQRHLGDRYSKLAHIATHFNHTTDHNARVDYLSQFRHQASQVAEQDASILKHSNYTADQKIEAIAGHRAAGQRLLAIADAVTL